MYLIRGKHNLELFKKLYKDIKLHARLAGVSRDARGVLSGGVREAPGRRSHRARDAPAAGSHRAREADAADAGDARRAAGDDRREREASTRVACVVTRAF